MKPVEGCGVIGIYSFDSDRGIVHSLYDGLTQLEHRGHESYGLAIGNKRHRMRKQVKMGHVFKGFSEAQMNYLEGHYGIGHVRYSTAGSSAKCNAQPAKFDSQFGVFYLALNGTMRNYREVRQDLERQGIHFETDGDTEVLGNLIGQGSDPIDGIKNAARVYNGSCSMVMMTGEGIFAARDTRGIKPLAVGIGDGVVVVASETCAIDKVKEKFDISHVRDVGRGEIKYATTNGSGSEYLSPKPPALDIFELVYFARADSVIDGIDVAKFRLECGRELARRDAGIIFPGDQATVVPVPYSGILVAQGYSLESGIPYLTFIIRKRTDRSFIQPDQGLRDDAVDRKFTVLGNLIAEHRPRIILGDDSLVRGTTSRKLVRKLKAAGAREVHGRFALPEVRHTCPYGIDMKSEAEHMANMFPDKDERAAALGFDTLEHLTPRELVKVANRISRRTDALVEEDFCMRCLTGRDPEGYPV